VWPSMRRVAHHLTACCSIGRSLTDGDEFSVCWRPRGEAKAGEGVGGGAGAGEEALTTVYGAGVHLKSTSKRPLDHSGGHLRQRYFPECKAIRRTSVYTACRNPTAGAESFFVGLRPAQAALWTTCGQPMTKCCTSFEGNRAGGRWDGDEWRRIVVGGGGWRSGVGGST